MAVAAAEAANFYPVEQTIQPHLELLAGGRGVVETLPAPEDELARRRSDQFKGHVAIEGLQAEYDAVTEFAELVDGQMRTELELSFDGHDLYGPDGRSLIETGRKGLQAAREAAKQNPNLWFEVGRRSLELEEVLEAVEMIKSGEANTMLVTTDFPVALKDAEEDVGGYNVTRQQALARAITVNEAGKILLISQTLDGSNRQALDAVHAEFGSHTKPGELLGQRKLLNLAATEQAGMMDRITGVYDREMSRQFGGEWYAGRRPVDYRNTYDFVRRQHDLIDVYKRLKLSGNLTNNIMYDLAATMNARFKESTDDQEQAPQAAALPDKAVERSGHMSTTLYQEITMRGILARRSGKSFSACGSTWKAEGSDESTEDALSEAGYGSKTGEMTSWHGGKVYKNAKCVSCEKVKSEVGACRICKDCVAHPKNPKKGTTTASVADPKAAKPSKQLAPVISLDKARNAREEKQAKPGEAVQYKYG